MSYISSGYDNKIPYSGWLKQLKFISYNSRSLKVQGQGASKVGFIIKPFLLPVGGYHPAVCSYDFFLSVGMGRMKWRGERGNSSVSSYKGTH